jgi:hypothetical protein
VDADRAGDDRVGQRGRRVRRHGEVEVRFGDLELGELPRPVVGAQQVHPGVEELVPARLDDPARERGGFAPAPSNGTRV